MIKRQRDPDMARRRNRRNAVPGDEITGRMLIEAVKPSRRPYVIATPNLGDGDVVIRGQLNNYICHGGLRVHATDTVEAHDLNTQVVVDPELTVAVFIEGVVEHQIGGASVSLGGGSEPMAHAWSVSSPTPSRRISKKGTRIRKVLVSAPHEWIRQYMDESPGGGIDAFMRTQGAHARWIPSKRLLALCEQILNPPEAPHVVRRTSIESKAIEILTEGLTVLAGEHETIPGHASMRAVARARMIRSHVLEHLDGELHLAGIAKDLGMSAESMQRAFKEVYGLTIVDFVREYRLHRAREAIVREGMSVSEAAYRAGYTNPANFSTAFKRLFGLTPSESKG